MSKKVNWTITDQSVVVNYDGETHIVKRTDKLADQLINALKHGETENIPNLVSAAKRIENFSNGQFKVVDGKVVVNGFSAPEVLSRKILKFSDEGLPYQPLVHFAEKLQQNPSYRAVNELYQFLEKNDHPITEFGNFIAYKRVRQDFKDIHSGTMDNSVGNVLEVARNQVDEDSSRTCSYGLHVANWEYAHTQFASHNFQTDVMLEVEVNPADVVAIPTDYNQSKMRVCRYKVLGVVTTPFDPSVSLRIVDSKSFEEDSSELQEDEQYTYCVDCNAEVFDGEELCPECEYDRECEDEECEKCGCTFGPEDGADGFCYDCLDDDSSDEESSDEYPWDDELE